MALFSKKLTRRISIIGCGVLLFIIGASTAGVNIGASSPSPNIRLASLVSPPISGSIVSPDTIEHVAFVFKPQGNVQQLVNSLYTIGSPMYHKWLTPQEFVTEFAPPQEGEALNYFQSLGLEATQNGLAIDITSPAIQLENALSIHIVTNNNQFSTNEAPLLPEDIANNLQSVLGLNSQTLYPNLDKVNSLSPSVVSNSACQSDISNGIFTDNGAIDPVVEASAIGDCYGLASLPTTDNGTGKNIALVEYSKSSASDTQAYNKQFNLNNTVNVINVSGGATDTTGTDEVQLDIDITESVSPGATLDVYQGPNGTSSSEYNIFNSIIQNNKDPIISESWGSCELDYNASNPGEIQTENTLFQQAATQGISIFASSGDSGSAACHPDTGSSNQNSLAVNFPASDPNITGVGGTTLILSSSNNITSESTWNSGVVGGSPSGGGGGYSSVFQTPSWQSKVNSNSNRGVPDISALADPAWPYATYSNGLWSGAGGTSASAPLIASTFLDMSNSCTDNFGNIDPELYSLVASNPNAVTNIITGNNDALGTNGGKYAAGPGWNAATGLGSPIFQDYQCPSITSISPTSGGQGTQVTVTGTNLTNAAFIVGADFATVNSATSTSATITMPAGSGSETIIPILFASGQSATFSYSGGATTTTTPGGSTTTTPGATTTTTAPTPGAGYWVVTSSGTVTSYGDAPGSDTANNTNIVSMVVDTTGTGYWTVSALGAVNAYGSAVYYGSIGQVNPSAPSGGSNVDTPKGFIVGIATTHDGKGYWLTDTYGEVFAFGDAVSYGSASTLSLNKPVDGIMTTSDGKGYWLVAQDGGVFSYGDATFYGSTGNIVLENTVVGIASSENGYWLLANNGGVIPFGNASWYSSLGGKTINSPAVSIASTPDGKGYWIVTANGGVFTFGDATFYGSNNNQNVVGIVVW